MNLLHTVYEPAGEGPHPAILALHGWGANALDLLGLAPEIIGDPRRSMFRIHRDVRFSKNKSPYKTHAACWFSHRNASHGVGSETHGGGAGFYFHLEPGASFLGGGIWMPPRPSLHRIRESIAARPADFARFAGHVARVELGEPIAGRRRFTGTLRGLDEAGAVKLDLPEGPVTLPFAAIERAKLELTDALLAAAKPTQRAGA